MSAADSLSKFGGGVKSLAIGAAIIGGLVLGYYLYKKLGQGAEKVKEAGGFLFGADDAPQTLGTWVYDKIHGPDAVPFDEVQAVKTCNALWERNGELRGPICIALRDQGKLTPPSR